MNLPRTASWIALGLAGGLASAASAQTVSVTGFAAGQWGAPDATLGVTGYTVETFEGTILAPGLLVGWMTPAGDVTPAGTIPFTFNPNTEDSFGTAFLNGQWDGSRVLVNTRTNQSYDYNATANWGDIVLSFSTPVTSVGFSLQQNEMDIGLLINGTNVGTLQGLTGIGPNGDKYGYIRIDGTGGTTINSVQLSNGRDAFNDGFVIDHVAFAPIPEPAVTAVTLAVLVLALAGWRRRVSE